MEVVGGEWEQYYLGIVFPSGFEDYVMLKEMDRILTELNSNGEMELLVNKYVKPQGASCKQGLVSDTTSKISFQEVAGLWIVLAIGVVGACLLVIIGRLTVCGARQVARTKAYRSSLRQLRSLRPALSRLAAISIARRSGGGGGGDGSSSVSSAAGRRASSQQQGGSRHNGASSIPLESLQEADSMKPETEQLVPPELLPQR